MNRLVGVHRTQGGFSLIEVMIALLVLGFGLLGLALLQTMNLRYTQSANQRTQAVNLATELIDMMRSNRSELNNYALSHRKLDTYTVDPDGCQMQDALGSTANMTRWLCQARDALGPEGEVEVQADATTGNVSVWLKWDESNLEQSTNNVALADSGEIELETEL